ncbi:MAG: hypothetical protein OXG53_10380 [Chloroflexi bacterium]|nr:hypothetical protein [Chloroflexota bacterium]
MAELERRRMRACLASLLRNHWQVLLIVPLVIIMMTWPTFARIFDADEFWLHSWFTKDAWQKIWDAWHIGSVLAGTSELYYTDATYHPHGVSLAFHSASFPHALLLHALQQRLPIDDAYNLLYLMMLYFNAICAYVLIRHLLKDKWVAVYGAIVAGVHVGFTDYVTAPDLIWIGTLPLTVYFFHRSVIESRWRFAALAGFCGGVTAFISLYTFMCLLISVAIYAFCLALSRWRQPSFWLRLLLLLAICGSIAQFRLYPFIADAQVLEEGLGKYLLRNPRQDILVFFVHTTNPFFGDFFNSFFNTSSDTNSNRAYLGYINIFLIACAICQKPIRQRLLPWLLLFGVFAVLILGDYLVINGQDYADFALPGHFLNNLFPSIFRQIGESHYYQIGVTTPLAVLSCFGLFALLRSKLPEIRFAVLLLSTTILLVEYAAPRQEFTLDGDKTAYVDWLESENERPIKIIDLPQSTQDNPYYLYTQTLTGYPTVYGWSNRNRISARSYINNNQVLLGWTGPRHTHCLPHTERMFLTELDRLLEDGFTHVVLHNWLYDKHLVKLTFTNIPAAYDDGFVSVYRLRDLRLSCEHLEPTLPHIDHFATSPAAIPGSRSSILSFHPSEAIDDDLFTYLASLFSDWRSLLHLYLDDGELAMQFAGENYPDTKSFAQDNQVIYLLYNTSDTDAAALHVHSSLNRFNLCQRDEHEDGSVIEQYLSQEFSCELITATKPLPVDYDNGIRLNNALLNRSPDHLHLQFMWSSLPDEPHSISLQVLDAAGVKVLGQDSTIGHVSLARYDLDVSHLPPGDYAVKLVVYNYETKRSVSGVVSGIGERFERELDIGTIDRA